MPQIVGRFRNVVIDWSDVKGKVMDVVAEGKPWAKAGTDFGKGAPNQHHHHAANMREAAGNLYGPDKCSHSCQVRKGTGGHCNHLRYRQRWDKTLLKYVYEEACDYCVWAKKVIWDGGGWGNDIDNLRNGYRAPEFLHSAAYVPQAEMKRPQWSEEPDGELELSRLYGGYDTYYLEHADQEKKPGIRIMVEFAFAWTVPAETIEAYGAWVAGLLGALESEGYDLVVDFWIPLDNLYGDGMRDNILMRVKRENEVSDFTEWSALFAKTGYRHIGFASKLVAGDKIGKQCVSNLGTTLAHDWGLDYDPEESVLKIHCGQRGGSTFPKDKLNADAIKLGLIPEPQGV